MDDEKQSAGDEPDREGFAESNDRASEEETTAAMRSGRSAPSEPGCLPGGVTAKVLEIVIAALEDPPRSVGQEPIRTEGALQTGRSPAIIAPIDRA